MCLFVHDNICNSLVPSSLVGGVPEETGDFMIIFDLPVLHVSGVGRNLYLATKEGRGGRRSAEVRAYGKPHEFRGEGDSCS